MHEKQVLGNLREAEETVNDSEEAVDGIEAAPLYALETEAANMTILDGTINEVRLARASAKQAHAELEEWRKALKVSMKEKGAVPQRFIKTMADTKLHDLIIEVAEAKFMAQCETIVIEAKFEEQEEDE